MSLLKYFIIYVLLCFLFVEESNSQQIRFYGGVIPCGAEGAFFYNSKITDSNLNTYLVGQFSANTTYTSPIFKLVQAPSSYTNKGKSDGFLIKINKEGQILWHNIIQGSGSDSYISVKLDSNENPIICGYVSPSTFPTVTTISNNTETLTITPDYSAQPFLLKLNKTDGTVVKLKLLTSLASTGTSVNSRADAMNICGDKIIVAGCFKGSAIQINGIPTGNDGTTFDIYIISTDLNFNIDNFKIIKRSASTAIASNINFIQKNNDGYFFSGTLYDGNITFPTSTGSRAISASGLPYYDFFVYRTDNNIDGQWVLKSSFITNSYDKQITQSYIDQSNNLTIAGNNKSGSFSIEKISSNNPISAGVFNNFNASGNSSDIFIFKYNSSGDLVDSKIIGDANDQGCSDIFQYSDKLILSGYFKNSLIVGKDTLKTNGATNQDSYVAEINKNDYSGIGAVQIVGTGVETGDAVFYNNSNYNLLLGTTTSTSITLPSSTPITLASNNSPKSIYVANACPIIGIFDNPTTTNLYVDPSKPQTGTIELDVKGDVLGGYSYQWSKKGVDFSKSSSLTDLGPDTTYTVRVDYLGSKCSKTRLFTVLRSITEKSATPTNSTSCAAKDGTITAVVTNNTNGKYTVVEASIDSANWITGTQSGNDYTFKFTGLKKGDYQLYYRLTVGASTYHSLLGTKIFINEAGNLITWNSTTVNPIRCNGNTGLIAVSASTTSAGSLTYSVTTSSTPNYLAQNSYSNLTAGTYYINITDGACQYRATAVNLTNPAPLNINSSTNISTCYSGTTGGISVKAEGGTVPYQYQLMDGVTTVKPFQPSNVFSGLATSSNYTVTVKDVYGCTYTTPAIDLESLTSLISISPTSIVSHYYNSIIPGKIIIIADGGTNSTFTYKIDPTGYTQTQSNFENLLPNTYIITILHNAGCSYSEPFVIKDLNQAYPLVYRNPN